MTDDVAVPSPPVAKKAPPSDPDKFQKMSRQAVVDNYNSHRDAGRSPELTIDAVHVVWFSKTLGSSKAVIASSVVRGLLWEVTFNGHKHELYIDIYKKLNNVKVSLGDDG